MAVLNPILRFPLAGFCLALFVLMCVGGTNLPAQTASKEYQVKAAFLYNFAQFIEWPSTALTNADTPFCIGVLGDDPFGTALEETVQGETINGHKIIVEKAHRVKDLKNCQMIFICKSEKGQLREIMSELDSSAVLTVSEIDGFAASGGVINFYLDGSKVRFEINPATAQHDGLKVSSQLLSLGKIIQGGREGE
jgi:hypothetical protein